MGGGCRGLCRAGGAHCRPQRGHPAKHGAQAPVSIQGAPEAAQGLPQTPGHPNSLHPLSIQQAGHTPHPWPWSQISCQGPSLCHQGNTAVSFGQLCGSENQIYLPTFQNCQIHRKTHSSCSQKHHRSAMQDLSFFTATRLSVASQDMPRGHGTCSLVPPQRVGTSPHPLRVPAL